MKIGLVSDTHGDNAGWRKAAQLMENTDLVLHAGDVLYHGVFNPILKSYGPKELAETLNRFSVPMLHARGNCDSEVDQLALENPILSEHSLVSAEGLRILVVHGHQYSDSSLVDQAKRWRVKVVVRGHSHIHSAAKVDEVVVVNPGSPSLPQGDGIPTVGLIEDGVVRIMDVDDGSEITRLEI